jgi:hypothetical protein
MRRSRFDEEQKIGILRWRQKYWDRSIERNTEPV